MNMNHKPHQPSTHSKKASSPHQTPSTIPPPKPAHQPPRIFLHPAYHTTMAATLRAHHDAQPTHYLTYTFPALLCFKGRLIPIVLGIEENYTDFDRDVRRMLAVPLDCGALMLRVVIGGGLDVYMCEGNMWAVLRHLREARGGGCIVVEEVGWPVYPGFEGESLEKLVEEDGFGRTVFGS